MPTEMQVMERLRNLRDPEIGRSLGEMGMISSAAIGAGNSITVTIDLPTPAYPRRERITEEVKSAIRESIPDAGPVEVVFISNVRGKMSGGSIGLRAKNVIAVGSGKGGVGKSTVAASLAFGLKTLGILLEHKIDIGI